MVLEPCPMKWSDLSGDERKRNCEHCHLHVHNLSMMTEEQQRELLLNTPGRKCISYQEAPGVIPISLGKWRLLQRLPVAWRRAAALVSAVLPLALTQCASPESAEPKVQADMATSTSKDHVKPDTGHSASAPPCHHEDAASISLFSSKQIVGVVMPPPRPLWRRILFFWES